MKEKKDTTEEKILEAAKKVFVQKGMEGARMQEIADEAGINKSLLHYYFRSKEKLFDAIFGRIIKIAFPGILDIIKADIDFKTRMAQVIDAYLDLLLQHPYLPEFVLREISREPSRLLKIVAKHGLSVGLLLKAVTGAMERGEIMRMKPEHFIINVVSMCVFPFAARPVVSYLLFGEDTKATQAFLEERREEVKKFVFKAIE